MQALLLLTVVTLHLKHTRNYIGMYHYRDLEAVPVFVYVFIGAVAKFQALVTLANGKTRIDNLGLMRTENMQDMKSPLSSVNKEDATPC